MDNIDMPTAGTWNIDVSKPLVNVSQDLFGIFFEEINHAGHGGLYNQYIHNSNFEDTHGIVDPWMANNAQTVLLLDSSMPLNGHQPNSLQALTTAMNNDVNVVITNNGFWGMNFANVNSLDLNFFVYSNDISSLTVAIWAQAGDSKPLWSQMISGINGMWSKQNATFSVPSNSAVNGVFTFSYTVKAGMTARVNFDVVTLMPTMGWRGIPYLRPDLAQKVADLHPAFMRFPGGCYVEGDILANRFNWKHALGNPEDRTGHQNLWGYWSEDGLGLFEYLAFIEQLSDPFGQPTRAIWVVNNGISHAQSIAPEDIDPYLQDALDSVEFAQGSTSTYWGSIRAKMGHPAPFHIDYMAIGNEDCGKPSYLENYQIFYKALSSMYPSIKLISNCAPADLKGAPLQLWDYHIYTSSASLIKGSTTFDAAEYHNTDSKVFNSEYAVTSDAGHGNLIAAVAEAAWMTGLERNGDVVTTASYAPLFTGVNEQAWNPDAIVFNSSANYGTPSYYNQLIFSNSFHDIQAGTVQTLTYQLTGAAGIYVSVTLAKSSSRANTNVLVHKVVNTEAAAQAVTININNLPSGSKLDTTLELVQMSGTNPQGENSFASPMSIAPMTSSLTITGPSFTFNAPGYSVSVIRAYASQ